MHNFVNVYANVNYLLSYNHVQGFRITACNLVVFNFLFLFFRLGFRTKFDDRQS